MTYAQDAAPAAVALVTGDGYCLNGNRLRLTSASSTYGEAGSTYQTEIADFSQITAVGTAGNGPASFTVQGRNGLTYYYGLVDSNGNGENSQVLATGTSTVDYWMLSKVVDRSSAANNYVINYTLQTGTAVPYDILWAPVSAGSSSYTYKMLFNPGGNVPQSSPTEYVSGTPVTNSSLLSSIEIFANGTTVKDYFLAYGASPTTGRFELQSVTECADSAKANCLSPTAISYQSGAKGISSTETATGSGATNGTVYSVDMNGDGLPDLVFATTNGSNYVWWVQFATPGGGYGAPVSTGAVTVGKTDFLVDDFDGSGTAEILAPVGSTWYAYKWNGSTFAQTSTGVSVVAGALYSSADVDGDGLPDLVNLIQGSGGTVNFGIQLNTTGTGGTISFVATASEVVQNVSIAPVAVSQLQMFGNNQLQNSSIKQFDFDGDGRQDLLLYYYWAVTIGGENQDQYALRPILSRGTGTPESTTWIESYPSEAQSFLAVNWNDDACTDLIFGTTLLLSPCNGSTATSVTLPNAPTLALDWDGDGRTDALANVGDYWNVYLSTGTSFASAIVSSIQPGTSSWIVTDQNGDGLDDLAFSNPTAGNAIYYSLHNGSGQPPDLLSAIADGYGNSASPTYVPLSQAGAYYVQYDNATFPNQHYAGPLPVVTNVVFSDPSTVSGTYNQEIWYYEAWMNLQGRGFLGFYSYATLDSRNNLIDYRYFEQTFPYIGLMFEDHIYSESLTSFTSLTEWNWSAQTLAAVANEERYFPYVSQLTGSLYEAGGTESGDLITTSTTTFGFDSYGNAVDILKIVTDNDPNSPYSGDTWTTAIVNTTDISANQTADVAAWCLNMLDETQVTYSSSLSGSGSVTRTKTFTPDTPANCRILTTVTEPTANSGLYKVTEGVTYDAFGNVATDTVIGANMPSSPASRETQLNWGTTGQFLNTFTDPTSAVTRWTYTSNQALTFGVPDSISDPNSLTTKWNYDGFGRKAKETRPDGTSMGWAWSLCTLHCGVSNSVYQIAQTAYQTNGSTAIRTDTNSYDPLDRVTQTAGPTVAGTTATVQRLYNSLGLLSQQSMPFLSGATVYQQTIAYDLLNRPISVTRPISSSNSNTQTTTYGYAGRTTTVTDPYGHVKTTVTDVNRWLRQVKDPVGYTVTRAYDSAGSLTGVSDSVGNTLLKNVTVVYGIKPFITASTDADRGPWTYTVDSLGERTGWIDAKGQSFSMKYDALSRPLSRTEPDLFTQWNYGSAAPNWGRLTSECTAAASTTNLCTTTGSSWLYNESRSYDSTARLQYRWIVQSGNPGNDTNPVTAATGGYLYTLSYSATTGLLAGLTYPKSTSSFALALEYGYGYGMLQSVTDTSDTTATCGSTCVLWTANAANGFGEVTQETLGNGVVTNRSFDAVTSWLTAATAGIGGGSGLLNQSYLQDENGNITQRENNILGLYENFYYDADNRLCAIALGATGSCSSSTIVYDGGLAGPGNITNQPGVGTYTYPASGQPRPHAVTSITGTFNGITNPSFSYDANGNMTARASSSANIVWSSYNYPTSISASDATGSETVQFNYGPERQRWEQVYTGPSGTEQTYYVGKALEVVFNGTTNYRHYIYAGSEPVAVYSRTSAGETMSYMLEDHQGGVSAIASNAGAADVEESFSAFGTRRNPTTWSGAPTTADLNTIAGLSRQGYTFQTALGQSMGLNHMNGRVQDAVLGRFLSADPNIPDPTDAQSYNRYSYVTNNPLSMTDPTGFRGPKCPGCYNYPPPWNAPSTGDDGGDGNGGEGGNAGTGGGSIGISWTDALGNVVSSFSIPGDFSTFEELSGEGMAPSSAPNFAIENGGSSSAQGQNPASIPQASAPADYQIDTPITVTGTYMDAPNSPASTGVNLSPFFGPGSGFSQNDPGKAFLQTLGVGAGGAAVLAGGPAAVALGRAAIQAIPGQALGAFMELSGAAVDTNAARNVTQVVLQEGYPDFLEGMEQVGALYRSLEVPEVAGPEIPWGPQ